MIAPHLKLFEPALPSAPPLLLPKPMDIYNGKSIDPNQMPPRIFSREVSVFLI